MGVGGLALPGSVHPNGQVDSTRMAAGEPGAELGIERLSNRAGDGPAEHREVEPSGRVQRRGSRGTVIGVAGDAAGVEHQQPVDLPGTRHGGDLAAKHLGRDGSEVAVGMVAQLDVGNPEQQGRIAQLGGAQLAQVAGHAAQRGRLPMGEAQHGDLSASLMEGVEQATQTERLIVGVGDDRQDPSPGGECVMWRGSSALAGWGVASGRLPTTFGTAGTGPFADPAGVAGGPGCHWLLEGQAGRGGAVELVVDRDDVPAVGGEQGRGDRRPVAAVADHPHLARWHVAEPARQLVQRDVDSAGDVPLRPLQTAAHVEHDHPAVLAGGGQLPQRCQAQPDQWRTAGPPPGRPGRRGGRPVDADAGQLSLGLGDLSGRLAEQGQRHAPGDEPAEVGGEAAVQAEAQRAGHMPGGERRARAHIDHPLAGVEPPPQLTGVGRCGR